MSERERSKSLSTRASKRAASDGASALTAVLTVDHLMTKSLRAGGVASAKGAKAVHKTTIKKKLLRGRKIQGLAFRFCISAPNLSLVAWLTQTMPATSPETCPRQFQPRLLRCSTAIINLPKKGPARRAFRTITRASILLDITFKHIKYPILHDHMDGIQLYPI